MVEAATQGHTVYFHRHLGRDDDLDAAQNRQDAQVRYARSE